MDLQPKYIEIQKFLSIPDAEFDLEEILNINFSTDDLKLEILGKILTFIYYFTMFKNVKEFMHSVYSCIRNTLQIKIQNVNDFDELLVKNAILRFIQEYIEYAQISQKEQVLNFLADSFERLGVQPLIINLGLLIKPLYEDQIYIEKKTELEEVEVKVSDDEITAAIKASINNWLEKQIIDLEKQEELNEKIKIELEQLAEQYSLSKESKTYKVLLTEVIEMLAMRLTMLSLMDSIEDDLEPVPIK